MERLLTVEEVVELFQIKRSYLYALTSQKLIPHYKIGGFLRFRQSELEMWLAEKAQGGESPLLIREKGALYGRA
jgi:excisionase family DNA binding protein